MFKTGQKRFLAFSQTIATTVLKMTVRDFIAKIFRIAILCLAIFSNLEATEPVKTKKTEVVVVSTQHFITDMPDGYTPGHLRALLDKISPQVLAVEAPNNVSNPWDYAPIELYKIAKPWADEHKIKAIPVDWHNTQYQEQLSTMFQIFQLNGKIAEYQTIEQNFQSLSSQQRFTCVFTNSPKYDKLWRDYHAALHALYGQNTPWEDWNDKIVSNIVNLCRPNKGKRVAVVFGAAHSYYIKDALKKHEDIVLIPTQKFFPLDANQVDACTEPKDYLLALRQLNFQNYGYMTTSALNRLEGFLEKIKEFPQFKYDYHFFRGKLLLHQLKNKEALMEFKYLVGINSDVILCFDGETKVREASLVFVAIAKKQMGKFSEAQKDLQAIIEMPDVTSSTKQWAQQILNGIPQ